MKFVGPPLLLALLPTLFAAAVAAPATPTVAAAPTVAPTKPAADYTSEAAEAPLVPEYDPASAPPPMYAEPSDEDGIRQCASPQGVPIFTDRRCADLGATPQTAPPPPMGEGLGLQPRVRTCARNQAMLLDGVRAALESHDANRLADYYHWTGMDSKQGYQMMERLDAFSARQVVDVRLVRNAYPDGPPDLYDNRFDPLPDARAADAMPGQDAAPGTTPDGGAAAGPGASDAAAPRPAVRRPLASMLRVDQMRAADDAAANVTYFHLLTNAGCWWLRF